MELKLGPDQFRIGDEGEVIVNDDDLRQALESAGVRTPEDAAEADIVVGVVVGESF
jgi:hypothetical protein